MDYTYILKLTATAAFGIFLGAVSTIPVGAVQLQVIKRSLRGHMKSALLTAAGSVTSDLIYGILTLFGFGYFLIKKEVQIGIYIFGIVVLSILLVKMYLERHDLTHQEPHVIEYHGRISFLEGFTLAISNPGMVVWWIIGYRFYLDLNLFADITTGIKILFIAAACIGLGGYLLVISLIVNRVKKSFPDRFLFRANMFIITVLSFLVLYFIVKLLCLIFNWNIGIVSGM